MPSTRGPTGTGSVCQKKCCSPGGLFFDTTCQNYGRANLLAGSAAALADLFRLYDGELPGRAAVEEAIGRGGLVLTDGPAAYWEGKKIDQPWDKHPVPWALLLHLARKAPLEAAVGERDVYNERAVGINHGHGVSPTQENAPA